MKIRINVIIKFFFVSIMIVNSCYAALHDIQVNKIGHITTYSINNFVWTIPTSQSDPEGKNNTKLILVTHLKSKPEANIFASLGAIQGTYGRNSVDPSNIYDKNVMITPNQILFFSGGLVLTMKLKVISLPDIHIGSAKLVSAYSYTLSNCHLVPNYQPNDEIGFKSQIKLYHLDPNSCRCTGHCDAASISRLNPDLEDITSTGSNQIILKPELTVEVDPNLLVSPQIIKSKLADFSIYLGFAFRDMNWRIRNIVLSPVTCSFSTNETNISGNISLEKAKKLGSKGELLAKIGLPYSCTNGKYTVQHLGVQILPQPSAMSANGVIYGKNNAGEITKLGFALKQSGSEDMIRPSNAIYQVAKVKTGASGSFHFDAYMVPNPTGDVAIKAGEITGVVNLNLNLQ